MTVARDASADEYLAAIARRRAMFEPVEHARSTNYSIESIFSIPHSAQVHALAASPCFSHLYTGGSDGFIRRYATYPTLNGTGVDNPLFLNLTMKVGGQSAAAASISSSSSSPNNGLPESRTPVLVGYWENEEPGSWVDELLGVTGGATTTTTSDGDKESKIKWGPKAGVLQRTSPVYSLAVQREELWGLAGTGSGTINLFTIRHDEGQIRHVFTSSDAALKVGHHSKAAVSTLVLADDERSLLSGAWDSRILQWDLNTGAVTRDYIGHTGQISSIAFRPLRRSGAATKDEDVEMADSSAIGRVRTDEASGEPGTSPLSSASSSTGVAAALVQSTPRGSNGETNAAAGGDADADADADADGELDADGEVDDEMLGGQSAQPVDLPADPSKPVPLIPKTNAAKNVPVVGSAEAIDLPELSADVFLSTSIDGQVMLWDRRVKNAAKGGVRRFDTSSKHGRWAASACWSCSGNEIYVGRRSAVVEVYDLRNSASINALRLPSASGSCTAVAALPSGRHIVTASQDNLRLWDLDAQAAGTDKTRPVPYTIIPGQSGGSVSQLLVDPRAHFLMSASGNRGWEGASSENVVIHQIKTSQ